MGVGEELSKHSTCMNSSAPAMQEVLREVGGGLSISESSTWDKSKACLRSQGRAVSEEASVLLYPKLVLDPPGCVPSHLPTVLFP